MGDEIINERRDIGGGKLWVVGRRGAREKRGNKIDTPVDSSRR